MLAQSLYMGGAKGGSTTLDGKTSTVGRVKDRLSASEMVFSVPMAGLTVKDASLIRNSLPEGTTAMVVKNTLMNRAIDGSEWEAVSPLLKGSNLWFFIEEDIKGSLSSYKGSMKEIGKENEVLGGCIDGDILDPKQVKAVGALPSKKELMAKIAGGINAVPTKLARVIKAPNSKLARAIKLATEEKSE
mmetsp:Transcript_39495/g.92283  ORF Transcript_39495/g.92283 Transcript_39495/m.92283 type:complete len:188 (-) Transcript_39495:41-604(-)